MRIHSDEGGEFWNNIMEKVTDQLGIFRTRTEGYDPTANGKAERYIGILKHDGAMKLLETKMPITAWYWAMRQSAIKYRWAKLMIDVPKGAPDFGERVMVRRTVADAIPAFEPKTADGIFMAWNMEVIQGADVLIYQAGKPVIVTVSAPKPWPDHIIPTRQRWRVFTGPKGVNLWMGDQGGMVWGERTKQLEEELVTFEERKEASPYDKISQ